MTEQIEAAASKTFILHVRFAPDGTVMEIGERPAGLGAQAWFERLSNLPNVHFEALSGGRGVFRLSTDEFEAVKAATLQ
ncbi:hypothetical protein [Methylocella sp.]|uniref:hypothetical protein n=1 Tax=Methylocella sp. TaxID=1978226 RepID=UPI0037838DDF